MRVRQGATRGYKTAFDLRLPCPRLRSTVYVP
jgi:hypothetical protein